MKMVLFRYLTAIAVALPSFAFASSGDLYTTSNFSQTVNNILKITPAGQQSTFATGLNIPGGLAFDRSGNLFSSNTGTGTVFEFTPDGTQSTFASALSGPTGLAFDGGGNLFVAETDSGSILKFAADGTKSTFVSGLTQPVALAFDELGNLFVSEASAGKILKFSPDGTSSTFASGLSDPEGIAFDSTGNAFVSENIAAKVSKFLPDGTKSAFASGLGNVHGLAFDGAGNLFAALPGSIAKFTPDGTQSKFATVPAPGSLAFEPIIEKVRNLSARGFVSTGDDVLIGGFIVGGNNVNNNAVVVRAIGPSLAQQGVSNPLADPTLELHNSSGALIAANDNWQDTQATQISATGLAPTNPKEAAIYATLSQGSYTAIVRGSSDSTGTGLVEIYSVNQ
jgi:sugar lactone lactonase YvrE